MRARSKAREVALFVLYQVEISNRDYKEIFNQYLESNPLKKQVSDFSFLLIEGVIKNLNYLDSLIKKYVKNWEIDRIAFIDRNILRVACFELIFLDDIPPKVSINEAIELAKRFGDVESSKFINGILDKIYKFESKKTNPQNSSLT